MTPDNEKSFIEWLDAEINDCELEIDCGPSVNRDKWINRLTMLNEVKEKFLTLTPTPYNGNIEK